MQQVRPYRCFFDQKGQVVFSRSERFVDVIVQNPIFTSVMSSTTVEDMVVYNLLSAKVPGYWFAPAYKRGVWDGCIHLYNKKARTFPTGLLERVGTQVSVRVLRGLKRPDIDSCQAPLLFPNGLRLRDYQVDAVRSLSYRGRAALHAPTNAGKTLVMAALMRLIYGPAVVLVPKVALARQTAERLADHLGESVGVLAGGVCDQDHRVIVGCAQSVWARRTKLAAWLASVAALYIDECHHTSAETWFKIAQQYCTGAYYRYGFSGTASVGRADRDIRLVAATGEVIKTLTYQELRDRGISARVRVVLHTIKEPQVSGDYRRAYSAAIVTNRLRNKIIVEAATGYANKGKQVLILVARRSHCGLLSGMISDLWNWDGSVERLMGGMPGWLQSEILRRFAVGEIKILVATSVADEGIDISAIDVLIMAGGGGTKLSVHVPQKVGRALRIEEGKTEATIIDFDDLTNRFTKAHSKYRRRYYESQGFEIEER
jgi:superfamily II DNA or RNA helicase